MQQATWVRAEILFLKLKLRHDGGDYNAAEVI